jgi:hypothetical protein
MKSIVLAMAFLLVLFSGAEARQRKAYAVHPECNITMPCEGVVTSSRGARIEKAMPFGVAVKTYTPRAEVRRAQRHYAAPRVRAERQLYAAVNPRMEVQPNISYSRDIGPKPHRAWCGWFMQAETGVTSRGTGLNLNLAREWARVGQATTARVGAIVVWAHHVGKIVGQSANGQWIVRSGNDGNRVRERPLSVARAIAFRSL